MLTVHWVVLIRELVPSFKSCEEEVQGDKDSTFSQLHKMSNIASSDAVVDTSLLLGSSLRIPELFLRHTVS